LLRDLYAEPGGPLEISSRVGRSLASVGQRAQILGVRRDETKNYRHARFYKDAPAPRAELLASLECPGLNGHGCGNRLWRELVPSGYGYIAPGELDLVCVAGHRFRAT
jgi:hypothetical protein